jgi:CBS domain-containing protein
MDAARTMRERDVGDVLVQQEGALCGIVTDRDLVIRCLADGGSPSDSALRDFCSQELATLDAGSSIEDAVELMRSRGIRRLPILDEGRPVGIVSLGDLARERDPDSALGRISAAPANH